MLLAFFLPHVERKCPALTGNPSWSTSTTRRTNQAILTSFPRNWAYNIMNKGSIYDFIYFVYVIDIHLAVVLIHLFGGENSRPKTAPPGRSLALRHFIPPASPQGESFPFFCNVVSYYALSVPIQVHLCQRYSRGPCL